MIVYNIYKLLLYILGEGEIGFAQSHIGDRRLLLMPYKPLAYYTCIAVVHSSLG